MVDFHGFSMSNAQINNYKKYKYISCFFWVGLLVTAMKYLRHLHLAAFRCVRAEDVDDLHMPSLKPYKAI
jgi:hypothetical protein